MYFFIKTVNIVLNFNITFTIRRFGYICFNKITFVRRKNKFFFFETLYTYLGRRRWSIPIDVKAWWSTYSPCSVICITIFVGVDVSNFVEIWNSGANNQYFWLLIQIWNSTSVVSDSHSQVDRFDICEASSSTAFSRWLPV